MFRRMDRRRRLRSLGEVIQAQFGKRSYIRLTSSSNGSVDLLGAFNEVGAGPGRLAERPRIARRGLARLALLLVGVGLMILALEILTASEIVREGRLFSYTTASVSEVRVLDSVNIYFEEEVPLSFNAVLDAFNSFIFVCVAGIALLAFALLRLLAAGTRRMRTFFGLAALGAGFLAFDELFAIHESIGHNMQFLADLPGITQPDGAVVAGYVLAVGVYLFAFRDLLLSSRRAKQWFFIGLGLAASAVAVDLLALPFEEFVEIAGTLAFLAGYLALSADLVAGALGRETPTPARNSLA